MCEPQASVSVVLMRCLQVRFVNTECNENATRYDEDGKLIDLEQRSVAIFQQLSTALTPRFQLEMRGVLVRIEDDHRPPPRSRQYVQSMFVSWGCAWSDARCWVYLAA